MTVRTSPTPRNLEPATTSAPAVEEERKPRRNRRKLVREIIISAIVLVIGLVWTYPFLWMVGSSLKTNSEIFGSVNFIPTKPQWDNYARAWYEAQIGPYFFNTLFIAVFTIAITVTVCAMMGYVIGRIPFPGKRILIVLFLASVFLPDGYTIIPVFDLINKIGLSGNLWGIILAESGGAHVLQVFLFAGYFRQLPKELDEAAKIDGAGFVRTFWTVILPLAKPAIATCVIMTLLRTWNSFLIPLVLTLTRPELRTLAVGVYSFKGDDLTDWSGMTAASTISLLPIVIIFLFLQRYFIEGLSGAVRG